MSNLLGTLRRSLLSPLPSMPGFAVRFISNIFIYYPSLLFFLLMYRDHFEQKRQLLIKKLNRIGIDPYLGIVCPSKDGIYWDGNEVVGDCSSSLLRSIYFGKKYSLPDYDDVVIDVGAHIGIYSLYASNNASKVISIEPHPINYENLVRNVSHRENIIFLNIALGDTCGKIKLYIHSSLGHSIVIPSDEYVYVNVYTLDKIVSNLNLENVDIIKINAEGAEINVLKGGINTLEKFKPLLLLGVHHYKEELNEIIDLFKKLKLMDYYDIQDLDDMTIIFKPKRV